MQRYFIQFTYWGTQFRGLQKQLHRPLDLHKLPEDEISEVYTRDEVTVQGALESALWHSLKPSHHVKLATSCRQDAAFFPKATPTNFLL